MEKRKYLVILEVYAEEGQGNPLHWDWTELVDGEANILSAIFLGTHTVEE